MTGGVERAVADDLVAIRKTVGSCHVKEADILRLIDDVRETLGSDVTERWTHGYIESLLLETKQADGKRVKATGKLFRVKTERKITASTWQDLADSIRAKQKSRRLEHLSVQFDSKGDKLTLSIGSANPEVFQAAKFRVQVEAFGNLDRLKPVFSDILRRLDRPRDRAAMWAACKHVTYLALAGAAIWQIMTRVFSRSTDGSIRIEAAEKVVPVVLGSMTLGVLPLIILTTWLSYATSARIIMKRRHATKKSRVKFKGAYERLAQALHETWLVRPFTKDAPSGAVVLALMTFPLTVLGLIVAVIALLK
ncbi:hypothetical protein AB0M48_35220 [Lentzea sp. NPDC051208]|uniref:hypothetical protein n=1 Tax=Lentzea sp. NPDC051208 TaxID=3154642 RepID=UPI003439509F